MSVINICGVLIHTLPEQAETLKRLLEEKQGVEVHAVSDNGRLVVTVEKDTREETGETLNYFQNMDHVISASLVYQYFDDEVAEQEISQ